jgi:hypothetical protein
VSENREKRKWTVHVWAQGYGGTPENPFWTDVFTFVEAEDLVGAVSAYHAHHKLKPGELIYKVRDWAMPVGEPYAYVHPHFDGRFEGKEARMPFPEFKELYGYRKPENYPA